MRILVISHKHHLLPFAWRLAREGNTVHVKVQRDRYQRAWAGKLARWPGQGSMEEQADEVAAATRESDPLTVLTDSLTWQRLLRERGAQRVVGVLERPYPEDGKALALAVGGWWTGEQWHSPHLWLQERGLWPGGLGPATPGAGMAVHLNYLPEAFGQFLVDAQDELKSEGFVGLVQLWVGMGEGGWAVRGLTGGWPFLHTQAFVSELEDFGALLCGEGPAVRHRYITVLPVSVPPWPTSCNVNSVEQPVTGLGRDDLSNVFFHDVVVDGESQTVRVAGTDGLVGVVRGASNYPSQSRALAHEIATRLTVGEKQLRLDGAVLAERFLLDMERATGVS